MKKILLIGLISCGGGLFAWHSSAAGCTVCHSKNPAMVRMHAALEYKDCFTCHGPQSKKSDEKPVNQRVHDERCIRCHRK